MPYDERFFKRRLHLHEWEKRLANDFFTRYEVRSVVDLGCGIGSFLEAALDLPMDRVRGYELHLLSAFPYISPRLRPHVSAADVSMPIHDAPYDCAWSVEVGEHLEPSGTDGFVKNLVSLSSRLIVLTCAPPGQRGTSHINLRPKQEWIDHFLELGVTYLKEETEDTAARWGPLGAPPYIVQNLMLFKKFA